MKKILSLLLVLIFISVGSLAQASEIDLTSLSNEELLALWEAAGERLVEVGAYPYIEITSKTFGEPVLRLQNRLAKLYYYTQEPSGQYDKATSKAFAAFMKQNGQKAGKSVTVENQQYLYSTAAIPAATPTPPPTPTPAPAPFFFQQPLNLTGPVTRFVDTMSDESLSMKLIPEKSHQNEFYTINKWKYDYNETFTGFPSFTTYFYTWAENSSGQIVALAFTIDTLTSDDSIEGDFSELVNSFALELGCSSRIRYDVDKATTNYFKLVPDEKIYGDQLLSSQIKDSLDAQNYMGLHVIFTGTESVTFSTSRGVALVIGIDDRISSLPNLEYAPVAAPTPTPDNPATVSAPEFNKVYVGMPYDDVVYIFGGRGQLGSSSKTNSGVFSDYTWKSESGGTISITFLDGKVYMASNYR